jgi:hypothetical protein
LERNKFEEIWVGWCSDHTWMKGTKTQVDVDVGEMDEDE